MSNGFSRAKGKRGELDIAHKLGGKRVGVAYLRSPVDVQTDFAVYQVRNRPMGATAIYDALKAMENVAPEKAKYVVIKPVRGVWICCEFLTQHQEHHYDKEVDRYIGGQSGNKSKRC